MPTMSSSFLKPSVTPVTALATRLRARPWNLPSAGSSRSVFATSVPSSCAKVMPGGMYWLTLPFGPCTSTLPDTILTLTPLGSGIGFLPIRDIVLIPGLRPGLCSPHVAKDFAADAGLARRAAGHHAPRRRQDVGAESAEHRRHVVHAEIDAAARAADPLDAGDHLLAVRSVLQEQADHLARRATLRLRLLDQAVALDVALVLEDPRNLGLQLARRKVHPRVLGGHGVADAREHVGNRIGHLCVSLLNPMGFTRSSSSLP